MLPDFAASTHDPPQHQHIYLGATPKAALDPVGGLISDLTLNFNAQGADEEVNAYLTKHCGRPK